LPVNLISRADINLENGDIVSIKASCCEKTSHSVPSWFINNSVGLLVPHPDTLISSTAVVGSLFCPRRGVLSEWFRGIDSDSTIMVIGSLVHELFQEVIHIFSFL
jgi:DNA replication ATP-dependent helicase Dna2